MTSITTWKLKSVALVAAFVLLFGALGPLAARANDTPPADTPTEQATPPAETPPTETPAPSTESTDTPAPTSESASADTLIETGDAGAVANAENHENSNDLTTPTTGDTTVNATNTAETTNSVDATSDTGANTATGSGSGGYTEIYTGMSYASANAINVINTNIIDSAGLLAFQDLFSALGLDLRGLDLSYFSLSGTPGCMSGCPSSLSLMANNNASTTNSVNVYASSGGNTANGNGDTYIETGDAYASGNAVNIINSNIVRSNYLLIGINNFGSMLGDIVLPGADFFEQLLAQSRATGNTNVAATNDATVTNSTNAGASTGGNTATGAEGAYVETGNAISSATTYNQVNSTSVGGTSLFFLFRIWGSWSGSVQGLPAGMQWAQTPYGIMLMNADGSGADVSQLSNPSGCASCNGGSVNATTTNTANLTNNVNVFALTGENQATSASSSAAISTGNAYAAANSVNIVNTNLIGHNWILAIFNIFGDLSGNISFGHPDLWLGAAAETGNPTLPGSPVEFHFTISNRGDADANDVKLTADFLDEMLNFEGQVPTPDGVSWNLGSIPKGQTREFVYNARAGLVPAGGVVAVPVNLKVTSSDTDQNPADNSENITIVVTNPLSITGSTGPSFSSDPKIVITKEADRASAFAPDTVNYTVHIMNNGGTLFDAYAYDTLTGPDGQVVKEQEWNLHNLNFNDEIKATYAVQFPRGVKAGKYTNTVTVTGLMHYPDGTVGSVEMEPVSISHELMIFSSEEGAPLCEPYLLTYIRPGAQNDEEDVTLLQEFLVDREAENGVTVNGVYDDATIDAVKRFQIKYADDILQPWGYNRATGYVYYTTQKKINDIMCDGSRSFALSPDQLSEISSTRALLQTFIKPKAPKAPAVAPAVAPAGASDPTPAVEKEQPLPPGIQVGVIPNPPKNIPAPKKKGFMAGIKEIQNSFMANVLSAFAAVSDVVAVNK